MPEGDWCHVLFLLSGWLLLLLLPVQQGNNSKHVSTPPAVLVVTAEQKKVCNSHVGPSVRPGKKHTTFLRFEAPWTPVLFWARRSIAVIIRSLTSRTVHRRTARKTVRLMTINTTRTAVPKSVLVVPGCCAFFFCFFLWVHFLLPTFCSRCLLCFVSL